MYCLSHFNFCVCVTDFVINIKSANRMVHFEILALFVFHQMTFCAKLFTELSTVHTLTIHAWWTHFYIYRLKSNKSVRRLKTNEQKGQKKLDLTSFVFAFHWARAFISTWLQSEYCFSIVKISCELWFLFVSGENQIFSNFHASPQRYSSF